MTGEERNRGPRDVDVEERGIAADAVTVIANGVASGVAGYVGGRLAGQGGAPQDPPPPPPPQIELPPGVDRD